MRFVACAGVCGRVRDFCESTFRCGHDGGEGGHAGGGQGGSRGGALLFHDNLQIYMDELKS